MVEMSSEVIIMVLLTTLVTAAHQTNSSNTHSQLTAIYSM